MGPGLALGIPSAVLSGLHPHSLLLDRVALLILKILQLALKVTFLFPTPGSSGSFLAPPLIPVLDVSQTCPACRD